MRWRGGPRATAAYEHHLDAARHAQIHNQRHERLRAAFEQGRRHPRQQDFTRAGEGAAAAVVRGQCRCSVSEPRAGLAGRVSAAGANMACSAGTPSPVEVM